MPRQSNLTESQKSEIAQLKEIGTPYKEIAKQVKLNPLRVLWYMAEQGLIK